MAKIYLVTWKEILCYSEDIEAESEQEALEIAKDKAGSVPRDWAETEKFDDFYVKEEYE